ncbi:MAG: hypothetical protein VYE73_18725 [Acidobacteriota bacterium]|nr:hypothetical protein [Acidobacteriota bacterium]
MPAAADPDHGDRRRSLTVLLGAVAMTAVIALPVAMAPRQRLFGNEIVGRHADAYTMIRHFDSPMRLDYFTQPATDWLGVLLGSVFGGTIAYNLLVLATFPLAALTTYWLARYLQIPHAGSAFAAFAFAFSPFHLAHAAYHPHIAQVQWIPLYLLALVASVDHWTPLRAFGLGGATVLAGMSNFYAALILAALTPVAIAAFALTRSDRRPETASLRGGWIATIGTLAALGGAGLGYVYVAAPSVLAARARFGFPYEDMFRYSARWWSYFIPPVDHALLGERSAAIWQRHGIADGMVEQQVYLSVGLLALAAIACVGWVRGRSHGRASLVAIVVVGAAAFFSSLGPVQRLGGGLEVPRLSGLLHPLLPMFRAYARFGSVLFLAVALAAGLGLTLLWGDRRGRAVATALAALVIFELGPLPWRWHWVLPTAAHRWAAEQESGLRILECVDRSSAASSTRHFLAQHQLEFLGGDIGDCAEPGLGSKLAALGHSHVLVRHGYRLEPGVPADGLEPQELFADSTLYRVTAVPAAFFVGEIGGFSWRERSDDRSWRWMDRQGTWRLTNTTDEAIATEIELEAFAFHRPREVRIDGPGHSTVLQIGTEPAWVRIPLRVPAGQSEIRFSAAGEPDSPATVLGSADTRQLTIGIGNWRFVR